MDTNKVINQTVRSLYDSEKAVAKILNNQVKNAQEYPHVGKYLKQLLQESQTQALRLQEYIQGQNSKAFKTLENDIELLSTELNHRTTAILYQN